VCSERKDIMTDEDIKITAYLGVFEEKLDRVKKRIKKMLEDRKNGCCDTKQLKVVLSEAKSLKKHVQKMREKEGLDKPKKMSIQCPHCNGTIDI